MTLGVGMLVTELRIVPHHPGWAAFYRSEAARLKHALGSLVVTIEHIGSTAVPDLLGKPIIDIGMTVESVASFEACVVPIEGLGYLYRGQHGDDPLRRYFVLEEGRRRMVQLHLWTKNAPAWAETIRWREMLKDDDRLRRAYETEKLRAAQEVNWEKGAYSLEKGPFIEQALRGNETG